jgi:2-haloacid dehalogenase
MAVRALVFDVFGTLVDRRSGVAEAFRASGVAGDPADLADAWSARYRPILTEVNEGTRPWGNFDELHLVTLGDLLAERGMDLSVDERRRLVGAWHRLDAWPDVRAGLEALRRSRVTAALSNGHVALLVDLARHADLRFDCVLSAELAHAYKPARELMRSPWCAIRRPTRPRPIHLSAAS